MQGSEIHLQYWKEKKVFWVGLAHAYNLSTHEAETRGFQVQVQYKLHIATPQTKKQKGHFGIKIYWKGQGFSSVIPQPALKAQGPEFDPWYQKIN